MLNRHILTCAARPGAVLRRSIATNTIYSYDVNNDWVCQHFLDEEKPCGLRFGYRDENLYYRHIATHFVDPNETVNMVGMYFVVFLYGMGFSIQRFFRKCRTGV